MEEIVMEENKNQKRKKALLILPLCLLLFLFFVFLLEFEFYRRNLTKVPFINSTNLDINGDGIPDLNIDYDNDGVADINIDIDGDGKPDKNLINLDTNGDGKPDLNVDTDGDGYPDINIDIDGDGKPDLNIVPQDDSKVEALSTILMSKDVSLIVKPEDINKSKVGNKEYLEIESKIQTADISLKSMQDVTTCKYNIIYVNEFNNFTNQYTMENGKLGNLDKQLTLTLNGYKMVNNKPERASYLYDLVNIKDKETILVKDIVISDATDDEETTHNWSIKLSFNNYRDYNQINNANKKATGKLTLKIVDCIRTKQ